jgi:hypothetical protein
MLVGVITAGGIGETFVLWTIEFLSGKTHYVDPITNSKFNITNQPLTEYNCHNFHKVRFRGLAETQFGVNFYKAQNDVVNAFFPDNAPDIIKFLVNNDVKIIALNYSQYDVYYRNVVNRSGLAFNGRRKMESDDSIIEKVYYGDKDLKSLSIPECREELAANMILHSDTYPIDRTIPHFGLSSDDLWNDFDLLVFNMMDWLGIDICKERLEDWRRSYNTWRGFHMPHKKFSRDLDAIVLAIVNNHYLDLSAYQMDFLKEVVILHRLIREHRKTTKLVEKFPNNTRDFFTLLEDFG